PGDLIAEEPEFGLDPAPAPGRILSGHAADQCADLKIAKLWAGWRSSLVIAQPATVLAWHPQGFQLYWRWTSRHRSPHRPSSALAESLRRARHRVDSPGMSRSRHRDQRTASPTSAAQVPRVLQCDPPASGP